MNIFIQFSCKLFKSHERDLYRISHKWADQVSAIHKNLFTPIGPTHALAYFCGLNATTAVTVAKGYNSRLAISHLVKDAAIANIVKYARKNNRNTLSRILRYSMSFM